MRKSTLSIAPCVFFELFHIVGEVHPNASRELSHNLITGAWNACENPDLKLSGHECGTTIDSTVASCRAYWLFHLWRSQVLHQQLLISI